MSSRELAAINNAEWCHVACGGWGIEGQFSDDAWTSARRTPDLFPDAVTFVPAPSVTSLLRRVEVGAGCSIKDSFAALDLASSGFQCAFEAEWIVAQPKSPDGQLDLSGWSRLEEPAQFGQWLEALHATQDAPVRLAPSILDAGNVVVAMRIEAGGISGGAVFNRSADVVGLSNVFSVSGDNVRLWKECLAFTGLCFPRIPVVGYERGGALKAAEASGCNTLGPLRIWVMV
jgi:hypothetical protein